MFQAGIAMTVRPLLPLSLAAFAAVLSAGCARALAQEAPPAPEAPGPNGVELVVYSSDFAMVRETRKVELNPGRTRVGLQGISKRLDQNSVLFGWPGTKDAKVVSSTYDMGVQDSGRLLQRFLGREIELAYRGEDGREGERIKGILEVADPGNIVVRAGDRYIVNPNATIEVPTRDGIVTIPQLSAEVESKSGGKTDLAFTYMTGGLSWNADYTATLAPDSDRLNLECWATVTNTTGTDYKDASIRFVAGAPNRVLKEARQQEQEGQAAPAARAAPMEYDADNMRRPEAMGELYAYPYNSTATIRQDQMNRVRMMGSESVAVKRVYSVAMPTLYREWGSLDPNRRLTAMMGINFVNAQNAGLGLPLPAGAVRVYEPDKGGAARYIGAAGIADTPKDARVSLELTNVFDVYARARQVSTRKIDKRRSSRTVEVTLTNEKAKPVELRIVQPLGGTWKIDSETHKGGRVDTAQNQWKVTVPAGGETKLRYTVILTS